MQMPLGIPSLQTVQAGGRQLERRKQLVHILQPSSAHQGNRAAQGRAQPLQHAAQPIPHLDGPRLLGDRDQRSVDVEKQRRSEEHTSELQSLMRISYAVLCLKKKNKTTEITCMNILHHKQEERGY